LGIVSAFVFRTKACCGVRAVCGRWHAGIAGSNPAAGMDVFPLRVFCRQVEVSVTGRSLVQRRPRPTRAVEPWKNKLEKWASWRWPTGVETCRGCKKTVICFAVLWWS